MTKLFLGLLVFVSTSAFAQKQNNSKISLPQQVVKSSTPRMIHVQGVLGLNNAKILADGKDSNVKDGFTMGVLGELGQGQFTLESGLLYMQLGGRVSEQGAKIALKTNYLVVPVYGKFYLDPSQTGFYGKAGVAYADTRSAEIRASAGANSQEIDFDHYVKNEDFMGSLAVGYLVEMNETLGMGFEFNYMRGTHRVIENTSGDGNASTRNEVFSLRASLRM